MMDASKMGGKVQQLNAYKGKLRPIKNNVIVEDMNFDERVTKGGIILNSDDGTDEGIRPRWARVYAKGPLNDEPYNVGDWVLIAHGRWSRGIDMEDPDTGEIVKLRRADPEEILAMSDEQPEDTFGTIKTFEPANPMTMEE
jgi:co-chaperonin GroES (HSP10)